MIDARSFIPTDQDPIPVGSVWDNIWNGLKAVVQANDGTTVTALNSRGLIIYLPVSAWHGVYSWLAPSVPAAIWRHTYSRREMYPVFWDKVLFNYTKREETGR
jgi:hypothetical protein